MTHLIHYPRKEMAREMVRSLSGQSMFSDAHNGLFLASPRRTGKSTFLMMDLKPEMKKSGIVVVYVDLWADLRSDPGTLIARAIGTALEAHHSSLAPAAKKANMDKAGVFDGLQFDTSEIGTVDGIPLVEALQALTTAARSPVSLIIDEAQQALTNEEGSVVMKAVKSARDQMNSPDAINLMLVMTGSDRDKLMRLVNTNSAPFYGSPIRPMPVLDEGFILHIGKRIEEERPDLAPVDTVVLFEAFKTFSSRPQLFMEALDQVLNSATEKGDQRFEQLLLLLARQDHSLTRPRTE